MNKKVKIESITQKLTLLKKSYLAKPDPRVDPRLSKAAKIQTLALIDELEAELKKLKEK